ncbi:hypothetical protein [Faecalimicrobium sp. JNUCC 81]
MKKEFSDVKLLMSVGGWVGSRGFYTMMDTFVENQANIYLDP